ncbi:MAG: dihydrolipoamide succinyltransferase, partial [Alphaproteobacteria bacterium]|nr:dihydrolipoamide succinyltransferase [Alphaproteobacteria bacterium]
AINALRTEYKESFEKKHGVRLGVMSFFVKACIQALKEFPAVNSEIDGDEIIYKNYYDIGVAVSTPQGLVVPVVRDADILSFAELEKTIASLAHKARDGKLSIAEMTGGTFTISNGGVFGSLLATPILNPPQTGIVFGSLLATPILNPPQTGILGMHKIEDRPVVIEGKIVIRSMMYLALSYDHRVIDGRESVTFLVKVKENLENPERLLLDM